MPGEFLQQFPRVIGKGRQDGHIEERPIISQPQCGRCHQAGTGQTTLEVIGSKRSYALNWCLQCKPNSGDDDDDDVTVTQLIENATATAHKRMAVLLHPAGHIIRAAR